MKQSSTAAIKMPIHLEKAVGDFERRLILQALQETGGVQTRAAELLGTTRRILRYRMDKLGIPVERTGQGTTCHPANND